MAASSSTGSRGAFGSRLGFILAAAGSAIGLGNIWRFPYATSQGGGGAFVLVYLLFVLGIGIPVLLAELSLGRHTRSNPVGAFKKLFPGTAWAYVGGLGVLTGFGILSFYSVVAGWTLSYLWRAMQGAFSDGMTAEASEALFTEIIASPGEVLPATALFLVLTALVVRGGIGGGIERVSKILMPIFFILLVALAIRSVTLQGAGEGLEFLFKPDFSKLDGSTVMFAMGQALFSLSLGMGAMITYGSYLRREENLASAGVAVAFFDTLIALLAGLIIFPALAWGGADPDKSAGLVFIVLPPIFGTLPGGQLFAMAFYMLLGIAALTSTISLLEVVVAYFIDEKGWARNKAVAVISAGCFMLAIPSALSQGAVESLGSVLGQSFLNLQSIIFGNYALSIGALLISLFVGWVWGARNAQREMPNLPYAKAWAASVQFFCPVAVFVVLVYIVVTGSYF